MEAPISRRLIFSSPQGFFDKAKIEHLARRHFFGHSQTFLGEIDGAAHPGFIQIAKPAEPAQMKIVDFSGQGKVLDAEIL